MTYYTKQDMIDYFNKKYFNVSFYVYRQILFEINNLDRVVYVDYEEINSTTEES